MSLFKTLCILFIFSKITSELYFFSVILVCILFISAWSLILSFFYNFELSLFCYFSSLRTSSSVSPFSLTLCVGFCALDQTATFLSLKGVVFYIRWISSFNPARGLCCLLNLCDCPSRLLCSWWLPIVESVSRSVNAWKGRSQSVPRCRLVGSQTIRK